MKLRLFLLSMALSAGLLALALAGALVFLRSAF
jgi:hypothetical protein